MNVSKPPSRLLISARQLLFEITCNEIQKLLAANSIPMLVLKGPHAGFALYDKPTEREYGDLDILIRPRDYFPAARLLLEKGYRLFGWNPGRLASRKADYQLAMHSPRGVMVELHRGLADHGQYFSDVSGFLDRAVEFSFGDLKVRGLAREDLLLHLCLHLGKRHFTTSEKKHLQDIARLLKKKKIEWPFFLKRVSRAGCRIVTHYCLSAAAAQHEAEVPPDVMASLCPGRWRRHFLDRSLDVSRFPLYRFLDREPGWRERRVNLLLMDKPIRMLSALIRFAVRGVGDRVLRVKPVRKVWMKRFPLRKWIE